MDLFTTSDAMILDSLSFISEYMVTGKPMCFLSNFDSDKELLEQFNEYGKITVALMDVVRDFPAIEAFIEAVCSDAVPENESRKAFTDTVLKYNFGTAGRFIANHILEQLRPE